MIKAIIFDVNGVLFKNTPREMFIEVVQDHQGATVAELIAAIRPGWDIFKVDPNLSEQEFWQEFLDRSGFPESIDNLKRHVRRHFEPYVEQIRLAEELRDAGYMVGILSNHSLPWFEEIWNIFRLSEIFDERITIASYMVRLAKPDVKIYETMQSYLTSVMPNLNWNEWVLIDDKERNLSVARELGVRGICFNAKLDDPGELRIKLEEIV